jgi:hypothetical protein
VTRSSEPPFFDRVIVTGGSDSVVRVTDELLTLSSVFLLSRLAWLTVVDPLSTAPRQRAPMRRRYKGREAIASQERELVHETHRNLYFYFIHG